MLVVHLGQAVATDQLVDAVWPETPPPVTARVQVRNCAAAVRRTLRSAVGDVYGRQVAIVTRSHGYRLDADPSTIDAFRFEKIVRGCLDAPVDRDQNAAGMLRAGLDMWTGAAFGALPALELRAEAARMEELKLVAIEELAGREARLGDAPALRAAELLALTRKYPYRERFWLLHMEALRQCGRLTEALARYREFRTMLVAEHGVEPGQEIRAKEKEILRQG